MARNRHTGWLHEYQVLTVAGCIVLSWLSGETTNPILAPLCLPWARLWDDWRVDRIKAQVRSLVSCRLSQEGAFLLRVAGLFTSTLHESNCCAYKTQKLLERTRGGEQNCSRPRQSLASSHRDVFVVGGQ
jgi:hypothetical protein